MALLSFQQHETARAVGYNDLHPVLDFAVCSPKACFGQNECAHHRGVPWVQ